MMPKSKIKPPPPRVRMKRPYNISKTPGDRFRVKLTVDGQPHSQTFDTFSDAERWAIRMKAKETGYRSVAMTGTLGELWDRWVREEDRGVDQTRYARKRLLVTAQAGTPTQYGASRSHISTPATDDIQTIASAS